MVDATKPRVTIYADGGADPDPGPGGWAVILIHEASGKVKELSGEDPHTTDRRMEIWSAIKAFEALKQPCAVQLYASTELNAVSEVIKKKIKKKEADADLLEVLKELVSSHEVTWIVRQDGDKYTRQVRRLANMGIPNQEAEAPKPKERPKMAEVIAKRQAEIDAQPRQLRPVDAEVYLLATSQAGQGIWVISVRVPNEDEMLEFEHEEGITQNQAQLMAAIQAFYMVPEEFKNIRIWATSEFLINGASKWMKGWKQKGWKKKDGDPVSDQALWQELDEQMEGYRVDWQAPNDDPAIEMIFEDIGRRAQEMFEEQFGREAGDDWFAAE